MPTRQVTTGLGLVCIVGLLFYFSASIQFAPPKPTLDVYVMSKCPDAQTCVEEIVYPALQLLNFQTDAKFEAIGDINDGKIACKHGDDECVGNQWILAAQKLYGVKQSASFLWHLLRSYSNIPSRKLFEEAAEEAQIPFKRLEKQVQAHGWQLLLESISKTKRNGVVYSCTVHVNGKEWCVVDGGTRKGCDGGPEKLAELLRGPGRAGDGQYS